MLNFIATGIIAYLLDATTSGDDDATTSITKTKPIPPSGWLPSLNRCARDDRHRTCPQGTEPAGFLLVAVARRRRVTTSRLAHPLRLRPAGHGLEPVGGRPAA